MTTRATTTTTAEQRTGNPFHWRFVTPLLMGSCLNPINSSLIATALVPIATAMHVSVGKTAVLVSALYLACTIAQPTAGKLSEEFGPRRVFLTGIAIVCIGGLVGGFGTNMAGLICARVLIGIGTSAGYPSAMLLVRRRATEAGMKAPPGSVLGSLVIAGMVTPALGLPIGGALVGLWGWRTTFFINVPVAIITYAMAAIWVPRDPRQETRLRDVATRIDLAGIVAFAIMMATLLIFLLSLPNLDWISLVIAIGAAAAFAIRELRAKTPFVDLRLLAKNGRLSRTYLRWAVMCLCIYTVLYGLTQWLEAGRGLSALDAGLLLLPMSALGGIIARPISRRNLLRWPLVVSAIACVAGSAVVLLITTATPLAWIVVATLLFGVVTGAGASANQTALYREVPAEQMGTASGLFRTFGYIGSIASSALIAVTFHTSVSDHGLHIIALIMVVVSVLGLLLAVGDRRLMKG
jgi:MFS family permease